MAYAQRKQRAIENVAGILADARDDAAMRRDEEHARAVEDRAETGERDVFDFVDDRPSPGFQRALDSARQSRFVQERFHVNDSVELDAAFGPDQDDDEREPTDEDDDIFG